MTSNTISGKLKHFFRSGFFYSLNFDEMKNGRLFTEMQTLMHTK